VRPQIQEELKEELKEGDVSMQQPP